MTLLAATVGCEPEKPPQQAPQAPQAQAWPTQTTTLQPGAAYLPPWQGPIGRSGVDPVPGAPAASPAASASAPRVGYVANAAEVVARMAPGFRRCYNGGLAQNPDMKGSLRMTAQVGPGGAVVSVVYTGGDGLSAGVVQCLLNIVSQAIFAPPEGGKATIVIPATFVIKDPDRPPPANGSNNPPGP